MRSLIQNFRIGRLICISKHSEAALTTLKSIHRVGILHGDIRPENILVSDSGITIIDFGHSRQCDNQVAKNKEYQQLRSLILACEEGSSSDE